MNAIAHAAASYVSSLVSGIFEGIGAAFGEFSKSSASDFISVETADSKDALATNNGCLVSGIRLMGCLEPIGSDQFENIVGSFVRATASFLQEEGHSIEIVPVRDYSGVKTRLMEQLEGSLSTVKRLNLDLADLIESKADKLSTMCATEDIFIALWTTPAVMAPAERTRALNASKERAQKLTPSGPASQRFNLAAATVRERHAAFLESVVSDLQKSGLSCRKMTAHEMCQSARMSIDPEFTSAETLPHLPGDPIPRVLRGGHEKRPLTFSDLQYPPLTTYLMPRDAKRIDSRFAQVGGRVYAPIFIEVPPTELIPFRAVFAKLHNAGIPWRASFKIDGGRMGMLGLKDVMASIASLGSTNNQLIQDGCAQMKSVARAAGTSIRLRIAFTTWADKGDVELARERASRLAKTLSAWGKADIGEVPGDPVYGLLSTVPFISLDSIGTTAAAPLDDVARLLPIFRSASPWDYGSMLYRTADGKVMPFDPGPESGLQNTWVYYMFAPPGYGKSVSMANILIGACTSPGLKRLPRIGIIDIGPTSKGVIDLIKDALPDHLKHQAGYFKLKMDRDNAINIFDLPLGCRYPLPEHLNFIVNMVTRIATPPEVDVPYESMSAMARKIVMMLYTKYADDPRSTPKRYSYGKEEVVDKIIGSYSMITNRDTTWWEIVDFLFEKGHIHEATLAQRHAVPLITDAPGPAREKQISDLYAQVKIGTQESLNEAFARLISDAARDFPILSSTTRFDIGDIRVGSINIEEVAKKGDKAANRQTAIMYMLARYALTKDYRLVEDSVKLMPEAYRAYHMQRIKETFDDPKWVVCDEFHRASDSPSVVDDVEVDIREGRKWKISVMLASQSVTDFPERYKEFATGVFILNAGTDENANKLRDLFGFNETAKQLLLNYCNGPTASGAPFLVYLKTKIGNYVQLLYSSISPIEYWALTTTPQDVVVRGKLYSIIGQVPARRILAARFPSGVSEEVKRLKSVMTGDSLDDPTDVIVDKLVKENRSKSHDHAAVAAA